MTETLRVDQASLSGSRAVMEEAADQLDQALERALRNAIGPVPDDAEHPGAEFDVEYAGFLEHASAALRSTVDMAKDHTDRLYRAARTHTLAAQANEETVRHLKDR
ncbi:hypothetical protein ABT294_30420 [Nonomuraea sp. NPDC000554]|uniref:hypothetical protein n=1 Tax=Nonomuraea sp. NPDC000554 TaxID=3154259 RepID=UPI003325A84F